MEFIKTGIFSKELSDELHWLFDLRNKDDYISLRSVTREEAELALKTAEQFVQAIRDYLQQIEYINGE